MAENVSELRYVSAIQNMTMAQCSELVLNGDLNLFTSDVEQLLHSHDIKSASFRVVSIEGEPYVLLHLVSFNRRDNIICEEDIWPRFRTSSDEASQILSQGNAIGSEIMYMYDGGVSSVSITWSKYKFGDSLLEPSGHFITYNDELDLFDGQSKEPINKKVIIVDTETAYVDVDMNASYKAIDIWPQINQIAWTVYDKNGYKLCSKNFFIKGEPSLTNDTIIYPIQRAPIHITIGRFIYDLNKCDVIVGHNVKYDVRVILSEIFRLGLDTGTLENIKQFCTMEKGIELCGFETEWGDRFPKLQELYTKLFHRPFNNAHDAFFDVQATTDCFCEIVKRSLIKQGDSFYYDYLELVPTEMKANYAKRLIERADKKRPYVSGNGDLCEEVIKLYKMAGDLGDPRGHYMAGFVCGCYKYQFQEARELMRKAVDKKYLHAFRWLASWSEGEEKARLLSKWSSICESDFDSIPEDEAIAYICSYLRGENGHNKDVDRAMQLCRRGRLNGRDMESMYETILKEAKESPHYFEYVSAYIDEKRKEFNDSGKIRHSYQEIESYSVFLEELAYYYFFGQGADKDLIKAWEYVSECLKLNPWSPRANYLRGQYLEYGLANELVNYEAALESYQKAYPRIPEAGCRIGEFYLFGKGCKKSKAKARSYLRQASAEGVDVGDLLKLANRWF